MIKILIVPVILISTCLAYLFITGGIVRLQIGMQSIVIAFICFAIFVGIRELLDGRR